MDSNSVVISFKHVGQSLKRSYLIHKMFPLKPIKSCYNIKKYLDDLKIHIYILMFREFLHQL